MLLGKLGQQLEVVPTVMKLLLAFPKGNQIFMVMYQYNFIWRIIEFEIKA